MITYTMVAKGYERPGDVPKGQDIVYHCAACGDSIPSFPNRNVGCRCGNIFIDNDFWKLDVRDFEKFEAWTAVRPSSGSE